MHWPRELLCHLSVLANKEWEAGLGLGNVVSNSPLFVFLSCISGAKQTGG